MDHDRASGQKSKAAGGLAEPLLPEGEHKGRQPQGPTQSWAFPLSLQRPEKLAVGWQTSLAWSGFITVWYWLLQKLVRGAMGTDAQALKQLFATVPPRWYAYSESAFATATTLNLLNLVFEDTPDKQQLALLSAVIKGLSWHSDHLITSGLAIVKYDTHGALFVPSRYVQWSCSTPTMIFTLSRISSLSPLETAATMAADWIMVAMGWLASDMSWPWAFVPLTISFMAFAFVQRMLWRMLHDAMREAGSAHARKCLLFTLGSTIVIWSLFPLAWLAGHITAVPALAALGEPLTMFCNFAAKVVFSTSIMFNNFVTLAQRRRAAREAAEHEERLQAVQELSVAVNRKDAFLAVVGHELRTPLNAICQLASALSVGAAGQVTSQAREWLSTIKASASHLLGVVNDIIMFRANQMGLVIKQEVVPLGEVVDEVLRTLLPSAGSTVTLEKVVHARMPPIVADRRRLVLALTNLVANSIKFMDKPNGRVTVKAYPDRGARHVVIKVVDNGAGLSGPQLANINDMARASQVGSLPRPGARGAGAGLGLPRTFHLASAHGGAVRITSPGLGQGTTATLKLPVLQRTTDTRLRHDFIKAYLLLGYSVDQLLSPEVAATEGRACPTFVPLARTRSDPSCEAKGDAAAPADSLDASSLHPSPFSLQAPISSSSVQPPCGVTLHPSVASISGPAAVQAPVGGRTTQQWTGTATSAAAAHVASPLDRTHMGTQIMRQQQQQGAGGAAPGLGPSRSSGDSMAAWEAYAQRMGYTLTAGGSGSPTSALAPGKGSAASSSHQAQAAGRPTVTAAVVPGPATSSPAFASATHYVPLVGGAGMGAPAAPAQHQAAFTSRQLRHPGQQLLGLGSRALNYKPSAAFSMRSGFLKGSASSSTRISIEEGDEEGEDGDQGVAPPPCHSAPSNTLSSAGTLVTLSASCAARSSGSRVASLDLDLPAGPALSAPASQRGSVDVEVDAVRTPSLQPSAQGGPTRLSDEVTPGAGAAQQQLLQSAATKATAGMQPWVGSGVGAGVGRVGPAGQTEWSAYLLSGGDPMAPACRGDAEAVVAANACLSLQYTQALTEARSKGSALDPMWHAWVARMPDHHRATPQLLQLASQQRRSGPASAAPGAGSK